MDFYENQLRQLYRLLRHEGHYTQCHLQAVQECQWRDRLEAFIKKNNRQPTDKEFQSIKVLDRRLLSGEENIVTWSKKSNGQGNVFIGRNPRQSNGNVIHATCLSLDIDPIREKETAATEEAHQAALLFGGRVIREFGWGTLCSSGNGALVVFPIPDTPVNEAEELGKRLEEEARRILRSDVDRLGEMVNVDATFDAARLVKAMGCISTKGERSLWRHARFITKQAGSQDDFLAKLRDMGGTALAGFVLPTITKGELDRSKSDMAIAVRLKAQGFGPDDVYKSLCQVSMRPGREDDYKRIVGKVFSGPGPSEPGPIVLWTPENGTTGYNERKSGGIIELPTGFKTLDAATFGLARGCLYTVGARTNCGKTTFAITASLNLCKAGKSVIYLSTETSYQEIWDRYFAAATGIGAFNIQNGLCNASDCEKLRVFRDEFVQHKFSVYDGSRPNGMLVRRLVEQQTPDVLIFDYFQHVEAKETRELEELVMNLRDLAKEKNIAILMCAQLHDRYNPATGKQYTPNLSDMKNCKALNDESRVVLLLDWDRDKAVGDGPAAVRGILAKNKGPKQDVVLRLDRCIPRFQEETVE